MRARFLSLLLLAAATPALAQDVGFKVIVHPSNPAQSITRRQLHDMFLKKLTHWPDGSTAEPVEPPERSRTRAYFLSDVMGGKSALAMKAFWQKRVFSGRDTPPLEKASDEEVVAFVKSNPRAIGYAGTATPADGVKVLELKD
jgi:ABC-type phosphate transport system substrate-binding protein